MKKRIAMIGGLVVAVGVAGGAGWYVWNQKVGSGDEETVYVTTVATLMGDVSGTQNRYAGVVEPQKTVKVKVESNRKVKNVKVKEGDTVQAGDVLFEYDASTSEDNLAQAELDLERYKNEANSLTNQIETLKKEKNEASADDQLSYTIEIQTAEMDLKKNEYNQKSKEAEIEKLKKALNDLEVTSDITGVIKKINDSVISSSSDDFSDESSGGSNESTTFITIVATGTYRVKGTVNETNRSSIVEGEQVLIRSRVDEDVTWTGIMAGVDTNEPEKESSSNSDYYGSEGNEQTTSSNYPFYVELDSADGLMLGQHVYIEMDYGQTEIKDGIWLDEFYITDADTQPYVWASTEKDRLEKREVTLGEYDEELGKYQITEGLAKTDCIAFPDESYKEGMKTTINENAQTPTESGMDGEFDSSYDSSMDSGFDNSGEELQDASFGTDEDGVEIIEEGVSPE